MEVNLIRALVALGIPGVALGFFYLLFRNFKFEFSQIGPLASAIIAIILVLAVSGVTFYALHRWAPRREKQSRSTKSGLVPEDAVLLERDGEKVTFQELLRSAAHDIVRINAHTHELGVMAEYEWIKLRYPGAQSVMQRLTTLDLLKGAPHYDKSQVHFDILSIKLPNGRDKEIYFDISSFFDGGASSLLDPSAFITKKLTELYS